MTAPFIFHTANKHNPKHVNYYLLDKNTVVLIKHDYSKTSDTSQQEVVLLFHFVNCRKLLLFLKCRCCQMFQGEVQRESSAMFNKNLIGEYCVYGREDIKFVS